MDEFVEVAYALSQCQWLIKIPYREGLTVEEAIRSSALLEKIEGLEIVDGRVGIFGRPCPLKRILRPGERVEIYRPLQEDPKQARRNRVRQVK